MRLYINGVLKNTVPQTGTLATNSETAKIGTWQGTNYNLTGRVSNVSIYNRVLTAAEVLENYNALRPRFGDVTNPTTGKIWMDRNLGATQVATSSTDHLAYGNLYQWGRGSDGHELINWTNGTSGEAANGQTLTQTDTPGNLFISNSSNAGDWRSTQNDNLWQGVSGMNNNPCPTAYRLPTVAEWEAESISWVQAPISSENSSVGALASPLKLPMAGNRSQNNGRVPGGVGTYGSYWSSTVNSTWSYAFLFSSLTSFTNSYRRASGRSVRCIKD
jgi:hypothetical protein